MHERTAANKPELLAPAGDWSCLRAAVANGANAIYFGLGDFNARRRATNFSLEELPEVMATLHAHNVKGYVAFNTLIFTEELPRAQEYARAIAEAGADAVIVQDLGLAQLIRRLAPTLPIHASTQMTQTEGGGIERLRELGIARVILARELSLEQIRQVAMATDVELEVFVHGALCISYSGQCLASHAMQNRSANRGVCAQPCRLSYTLAADGEVQDLGGSLGEKKYLLSTKDLAAYGRVAELIALGVTGFKIEGRLKGPHYVAAATAIYRAAIDAAMAPAPAATQKEPRTPFHISRQQRQDLWQSYSRGFSHGFLDGANHQELVHGLFPKSRGIRLGTVSAVTPAGVVVVLEDLSNFFAPGEMPVKPGDGVVFDVGRPDQEEQGGRVFSAEILDGRGKKAKNASPSEAGQCVELTFGNGEIDFSAVPVGAVVWKTDDPAVRHRLEVSFSRDVVRHRGRLDVTAIACEGRPLKLIARDDAGRQAEVASDEPLQAARKHPLTVAALREQLSRLGDTPFELGDLVLQGPAGPAETVGVMVPKSVLNELRRRLSAEMLALRAAQAKHALASPDALAQLLPPPEAMAAPAEPLALSVLVRTSEQVDALLACPHRAKLSLVYCDLPRTELFAPAVQRLRTAGLPAGIATPRILKPGEQGLLEALLAAEPEAILVRNLGSLEFLRPRTGAMLVGDFSLNVANPLSAAWLARQGLGRLAPAYELAWPQVAELASAASQVPFELVLAGHAPLFHTEHCPSAANLSGGRHCRECGRPCRRYRAELVDRNSRRLPIWQDLAGRTTIFGEGLSSPSVQVEQLRASRVRNVRLELLREGEEQVHSLLDRLISWCAG